MKMNRKIYQLISEAKLEQTLEQQNPNRHTTHEQIFSHAISRPNREHVTLSTVHHQGTRRFEYQYQRGEQKQKEEAAERV